MAAATARAAGRVRAHLLARLLRKVEPVPLKVADGPLQKAQLLPRARAGVDLHPLEHRQDVGPHLMLYFDLAQALGHAARGGPDTLVR